MPVGVIQRAFFVGAQKRPWSHDSGLCPLSPVFPRTCSRFPTNLFPDKEVEEEHMLDDHFHSTDAGVKYRDVTEEFERSYPKSWKNLNPLLQTAVHVCPVCISRLKVQGGAVDGRVRSVRDAPWDRPLACPDIHAEARHFQDRLSCPRIVSNTGSLVVTVLRSARGISQEA